jgi:ankyrin repeat protein
MNIIARFRTGGVPEQCKADILSWSNSIGEEIYMRFGSFSLLHYYCKTIETTSIPTFRYLLSKSNLDINIQDDNKETPLHIALRNTAGVQNSNFLLYVFSLRGLDVHSRNKAGRTPLSIACSNINNIPVDIFQHLIKKLGADIHSQDILRDTPLHLALKYAQSPIGLNSLAYLLQQPGIDPARKNTLGQTLLHVACSKGIDIPLSTIQFLIDVLKCDINAEDRDGNTPIYYALSTPAKNLNTLTYLLTQPNLEINHLNRYCHSLLHTACSHLTGLPLDIFVLMIDRLGFDINISTPGQDNPLLLAVQYFEPPCDIEILIYLLKKVSHINQTGRFGRNVLHLACWNIDSIPLKVFEYLVQDLGVDFIDLLGESPLHLAFINFKPTSDVNILIYLLKQSNVDVNQCNTAGRTLLHIACSNVGFPIEIFKYLIEAKNVDINALDRNHNTPIQIAFRSFSSPQQIDEILEYLLHQNGINANLKDIDNQTMLHFASLHCAKYSVKIFQRLIEGLSANINSLNSSLQTPVDIMLNNYQPNDDHTVIKYVLSQYGITFDELGNEHLSKLQSLKGNHVDFTEYILKNGLITTPIHAKKYLMWLCSHRSPSIASLSCLCDHPGIIIDYNDTQNSLNSPLLAILATRPRHNIVHPDYMQYDDQLYPLIEYLIEKYMASAYF